jgi:hypothetical protein
MAIMVFNSNSNIAMKIFIVVSFLSLIMELVYYLNSNAEAIVTESKIILSDIFEQKIEIPLNEIKNIGYTEFYFTFKIISNSKSYRLTLSNGEAQNLESILFAKCEKLDI